MATARCENVPLPIQRSTISVRWIVTMLVLMLGVTVGFSHPVSADTSCTNTISACGCVISVRGLYTVTASLNSTQGLTSKGDCITIDAEHVRLDLGNHSITGPGGSNSDTGIRVKQSAHNDTIVGGPSFAIISGWNVGLYIGGTAGTYSNVDTDSNDVAGIEINSSADFPSNRLTDWTASHEGEFGLWIRNGGDNFVTEGHADSNRDGIFVGCSDASGKSCTGALKAQGNDIMDNEASSNSRYGIALDRNARETVVNANTASGNTSDDLFDDSAACGSNHWLNNIFTTSNDTGCIK